MDSERCESYKCSDDNYTSLCLCKLPDLILEAALQDGPCRDHCSLFMDEEAEEQVELQ